MRSANFALLRERATWIRTETVRLIEIVKSWSLHIGFFCR